MRSQSLPIAILTLCSHARCDLDFHFPNDFPGWDFHPGVGRLSLVSGAIRIQILHQVLKLYATCELLLTYVTRKRFLHSTRCCFTPVSMFSGEQESNFAGVQFIAGIACTFCIVSRNHCQVFCCFFFFFLRFSQPPCSSI